MNHTSTSRDVIGFLKNQHEQIKGLFEQVLATRGPARAEKFATLKSLMTAHEAAEEEVVHPAARRAIAGGKAEVAARLQEESEAKKALAALEKLDVGSSEFESSLRSLQKAVLAHAKSEEAEELDELGEKLGAGELRDMREQAEQVEGDSAHVMTAEPKPVGGNPSVPTATTEEDARRASPALGTHGRPRNGR